jgi:hypothetical protein
MALVVPAIATAGAGGPFDASKEGEFKIPDGHGARVLSLVVDSIFTDVSEVDAQIRVNHPRTQDLKVFLKAPTGDRVALSRRSTRGRNLGEGPRSCDSSGTHFIEGGTPLDEGSAPYAGEFEPEGSFARLTDDEDPEGTWKLIIKDVHDGKSGTIFCAQLGGFAYL